MTTARQRALLAWRGLGELQTPEGLIDRIEAEIKGAEKDAARDAESARRLLIDANPLIFGPDGTVDHTLPLLTVARLAAERIDHLSKLHAEAVGQLEGAFMDGWKEAEKHHGIKAP